MSPRSSFATVALGLSLVFPMAARAQDASQWAGFYIGASTTSNSGDMTYGDSPDDIVGLKGNTAGLLLGYGVARGQWVFGGELAYATGEINNDYGAEFGYRSTIDLKARAGYAVDNLLIYGTIGTSITEWQEFDEVHDGKGLLMGIGADYLIAPNVFVGAEYLRRNLTSDYGSTNGDNKVKADVDGLTLRLGLRF